MRRDLWIGLLLAALTLGVFWPVRDHEFIAYDDPQFVTEYPQIQSGLSWNTLVYAFTKPIAGNWHPVTSLSHALDCEWFGLNPGAHHLVNALVHALNAALLFLVLQHLTAEQRPPPNEQEVATNTPKRAADARKGKAPSGLFKNRSPHAGGAAQREFMPHPALAGRNALIAALFAWHPLRVESVAWLAERKDLLAGFFFLLTLGMYALYARSKNNRETGASQRPQRAWVFYAGALVCFALGLMSKPMVVTLPFVLLLVDFWPLQRFDVSNFQSQVSTIRR